MVEVIAKGEDDDKKRKCSIKAKELTGIGNSE